MSRTLTNTGAMAAASLGVALMVWLPCVAVACEPREATPASTRGPHDYAGPVGGGRLWREGDEGEPLFLRGRVLDTCARPIPGARVQVLHANAHGDHDPGRWRAVFETGERGEFELLTVYPGYAGGMARHIHFVLSAPGHRELITRIYFKNDPALNGDASPLAVVLEEIQREQGRGWIGTHEFVLEPL